jgi:glycosyltransferase involved in cell wall biosynthesis
MPVRPARFPEGPPVAASEAMRRWAAGTEAPRVLLTARWPIGSVRSHLIANYSALCAAGFRFTFVGPNDASLHRLRTEFADCDGLEFLEAPLENGRCRLWPVLRRLLRGGGHTLLHSHGLTATVHASLANFGVGVPHVVTLHERLRPHQFPGWLGRLKRWTLARALSRADAIITASDEARTNLLEHVPTLRVRAEKIVAIDGGDAERLAELLASFGSPTLSTVPSEPLAA